LLPDRGVVKVTGEEARKFLNGLVTSDLVNLASGSSCFAALLTPQAKIIADFIIVEAEPDDGGGFFLDCPRALTTALIERLNFYRLRAKVAIEARTASLGVLALWDGARTTEHALCYPDPRLTDLGMRCILPPEQVGAAIIDLGAHLIGADQYEAHRIALGVPRGGIDFIYTDAFPHEADLHQLNGADFKNAC